MTTITSRQNPVVARFRAAARRDEPGLMLLDGEHLVSDALRARMPIRDVLVAAEARERHEISTLLGRLEQAGANVFTATAPVMAAASPVKSPSAIVALAEQPHTDPSRLYEGVDPLIVVVCDVQDPGNVGAIVRVAEAGGATGVAAAGACADPFGWKALRGSMGSTLRLPIAVYAKVEDAVRDAQQHGCRTIATTPRGGRSLFDMSFAGPLAVLIGAEGTGLSGGVAGAADALLTIPMQPRVESLNTAVAAALVVYEARRQRDAAASAARGSD